MTTVVYVAGYGRSGSTLLELVLQAQTNGTGYGELAHLRDEVVGSKTYGGGFCSCGERLDKCLVWAPIAAELRQGVSLPHLYRDLISGRFATAPGPAIDSSKTTRKTLVHFLRLRRWVTQDIRVIHLSRRPSDVYTSWSKAQNRPHGAGPRPGRLPRIGFVVSYLYAEMVARTVVRWLACSWTAVRFDQLTNDPDQAWLDIAAALDLGPGSGSGIDVDNRGHGIAGNRLRRIQGDQITIQPLDPTQVTAKPPLLLRCLDQLLN